MKEKINGRTPEEIKKGLECCKSNPTCSLCSYYNEDDCEVMESDALAYIQQLERERDAAVRDLELIAYSNSKCETCAHYAFDEEDESRACADCDVETYCNWKWRGVQGG